MQSKTNIISSLFPFFLFLSLFVIFFFSSSTTAALVYAKQFSSSSVNCTGTPFYITVNDIGAGSFPEDCDDWYTGGGYYDTPCTYYNNVWSESVCYENLTEALPLEGLILYEGYDGASDCGANTSRSSYSYTATFYANGDCINYGSYTWNGDVITFCDGIGCSFCPLTYENGTCASDDGGSKRFTYIPKPSATVSTTTTSTSALSVTTTGSATTTTGGAITTSGESSTTSTTTTSNTGSDSNTNSGNSILVTKNLLVVGLVVVAIFKLIM